MYRLRRDALVDCDLRKLQPASIVRLAQTLYYLCTMYVASAHGGSRCPQGACDDAELIVQHSRLEGGIFVRRKHDAGPLTGQSSDLNAQRQLGTVYLGANLALRPKPRFSIQILIATSNATTKKRCQGPTADGDKENKECPRTC